MGRERGEPAEKIINVWNAKRVWTSPCHVHRGDYYFYVGEDGQPGSSFTKGSLKDLARYIQNALLFERDIEYSINHRPPVEGEIIYVGGCFGRPSIPATSYKYFPLKRKQLKELEQYLDELRSGP